MKIAVCISNVPDTTTKVRFTGDLKKLDTTNIQWVINPWDELSLTRALELKDIPANEITAVTVAHVGLADSEPTIRKALAIGADDAIRVNAEPADAYYVASQLAEALRAENFDLILTGIESSDHNGSTVGGMVSELMGIPSVSAVSGITLEKGTARVTREIDGGKEILSMDLPLLAVVQKGIAKEPRIAAMRGIMMARSKPIKVIDPVTVDKLTEVVQYEKPAPRAACKFVDAENPKQLIELLQTEAKVF
jgi:electron transfer flavoprotein beta subunit